MVKVLANDTAKIQSQLIWNQHAITPTTHCAAGHKEAMYPDQRLPKQYRYPCKGKG